MNLGSYSHLILNSNPWFSAVSDYSLQIALYLQKSSKVLFIAEVGNTAMDKKCAEHNVPFLHLPIHQQSIVNFFKSLYFMYFFLKQPSVEKKYIWVFEGREHTLCALTKILFPHFWKNKTLIRIRGQAQVVKNNIFSRFVYKTMTDKVIFAAECVKNLVQFKLPQDKYIIQYYLKDFCKNNIKSPDDGRYVVDSNLPFVDKNKLVFIVIGRFDKVKGHDYLTNAYLKAEFKDSSGKALKTQMVYVGYSANITSLDMYKKYFKSFGEGAYTDNKYYLNSQQKNKELFIIDKPLSDLDYLVKTSSFGVIPSLDSEVICRVGVELMQCGVPVIFSTAGALPEVLIDFPFLNFETGNEESLRLSLEKACKIYLSKTEYLKIRNQFENVGNQKYGSKNYDEMMRFVRKYQA